MSWMDGKYMTYRDGKRIEVGTIDEVCDQIKEMVESAREARDKAIEKANALSDEKWKDETLREMRDKLQETQADARRGFPISREEQAAIREWQKQHTENKHNAYSLSQKLALEGVSGGRWEYRFVPTSIGISGICLCGSCYSKAVLGAGDPNNYKRYSDYLKKLQELKSEYDAEFEFQSL